MATSAVMNGRAVAASAPRRASWARTVAAGVALAMAALLVGDRGLTANAVQGIDPLEILNLQVKPNVVFIVDTSVEMGFNPEGTLYLGGDDPNSRLYQAKQALREVVTDNDGKANFGIIDLNANQAELALSDPLSSTGGTGPLVYVSVDANAATWHAGSGVFRDFDPDFSDYNGDACVTSPPTLLCSQEVHQSFRTNGPYSTPYKGRYYLA